MNNIIYKVMFIDMINERTVKKYCREDISLIENYEKALNDPNETWHCHHRLEIQGELRLSVNKLKELGYYWNRPACELVFLTKMEHYYLHYKEFGTNTGKVFSDEWRNNLSKSLKGTNRSEETKHKISTALSRRKGLHYYNNGVKTVLRKTCPTGFIPGRLCHK